MNKSIFRKAAAVLGILFSILTLIEGSEILLGITQPGYTVFVPLLFYNIIMGVVGIAIGISIWINHRKCFGNAAAVTITHLMVWLIISSLYFFTNAVALHSVSAMAIRSFVWLVIVFTVWKTKK